MKRALAVLAVVIGGWMVPSASAHGGLQFLGQAIVPTGTMFRATTVGGLSSITYDAKRGVYYALSDDPSQFQPARYYPVGLDVRDGRLTDGDVHFQDVTTFLAPDGKPYAFNTLDPEGLVLTKDRQLILTSEGFANSLIDPFVRRYALDGAFLGSLPIPKAFLPTADHSSGVRPNLAFESAGVPPDGRFLFTASENPLYQDGPAATIANGSRSRILRYNLQTGRLDRQYEYDTDPAAQPPVPASQFSANGIDEILPLNNEFLITMERSFSVGAPGTGNTIKLYGVALPGATDVNGVFRLPNHVRPARKQLLLDLDVLGLALDNVEGMTLGPRLRDGRQTLVLVSD